MVIATDIDNSKIPHIVAIEAYEGCIEFLSDEPEELKAARGLGLPLSEIAERLDCRITVLAWDNWWSYERYHLRGRTPATRPIETPAFDSLSVDFQSERVKRVAISTRDPDYGLPFEVRGLSPRSHGLINDSGLIFFASYYLHQELQSLYQQDPFQAVMVPTWGGIGYVAQMARATQAPNQINVPFIGVVTDSSLTRQRSNQEGVWTRHAIVRRQMEDLSIALADLTLVFGTRGKEIALSGRLPEASQPIVAPRFVEPSVLDAIANAASQSVHHQAIQFFLYEPQQAASGVLTTLDAVTQLNNQEKPLEQPVIAAGPAMTFAPMQPRDFVDYWSSRGFVQQLMHDRQWHWQRDYPQMDRSLPIRLYPSFFEYLPNVWAELARGSLVMLSPAAAEGLAPGEFLPQELLLPSEPTPEAVAESLENLTQLEPQQLDQLRRELCQQVVRAHQSERRQQLLNETVSALEKLLVAPPAPQNLARVALLLRDRRSPLQTLTQQITLPALPELTPDLQTGTLSVVIACYEMGAMLKETIESVWASDRQPDEVLLIDDGSKGEETLRVIAELQNIASAKGLPLKVVRKQNGGLAAARNTGLELAQGEFISFLDGDDLIEPQFYKVALPLLTQYLQLGGISAWASIFGTDIPDGFWNAPQPEFPFLFIENSVIVPCVTRTALLRHLGGYDTRQRYNYEDWELSIRILASGYPIVTVPMHLMRYRIRQNSLYRSMTEIQNQVMRELLLSNHREVCAEFAVEIAMQIEHQWKQLAYAEPLPGSSSSVSSSSSRDSSSSGSSSSGLSGFGSLRLPEPLVNWYYLRVPRFLQTFISIVLQKFKLLKLS